MVNGVKLHCRCSCYMYAIERELARPKLRLVNIKTGAAPQLQRFRDIGVDAVL